MESTIEQHFRTAYCIFSFLLVSDPRGIQKERKLLSDFAVTKKRGGERRSERYKN